MVCAWSYFFRKNNHRTALMESPMMAMLPIVQYHPYHQPASSDLYRTSIGIHPLLHYHQKTIILIIAIANQHHTLSTTAHLEPHQAPHMFHLAGLSHHAWTSSLLWPRPIQALQPWSDTVSNLIMPKHLSKELAEPMNINWKTSSQVSTGLRMDKCQSSNIVINND